MHFIRTSLTIILLLDVIVGYSQSNGVDLNTHFPEPFRLKLDSAALAAQLHLKALTVTGEANDTLLTQRFDVSGNTILLKQLRPLIQNTYTYTTYTYDSLNQMTSLVETYGAHDTVDYIYCSYIDTLMVGFRSNREINWHKTFKFDENDLPEEMILVVNETDTQIVKYVYDSHGELRYQTTVSSEDGTTAVTHFSTDFLGRKSRSITIKGADTTQAEYTYQKDKLVAVETKSTLPGQNNSHFYSYNNDGKLTSRIYAYPDGKFEFTYAYDDQGRLIEKTTHMHGRFSSSNLYTYHNNSDAVKTKVTYQPANSMSKSLQKTFYDDAGRIQTMLFCDHKVDNVTEKWSYAYEGKLVSDITVEYHTSIGKFIKRFTYNYVDH